jgi:hypothetical protein
LAHFLLLRLGVSIPALHMMWELLMNVSRFVWILSSVSVAASVAAVAGVSCTTAREPDAAQQLVDLRDDELYGDLESGLDSSIWVDDGFDGDNPIDKSLSESPYRDFKPIESSVGDSSADQGKRKLKKAGKKKKGNSGTVEDAKGGDWWSQ